MSDTLRHLAKQLTLASRRLSAVKLEDAIHAALEQERELAYTKYRELVAQELRLDLWCTETWSKTAIIGALDKVDFTLDAIRQQEAR